MEHELEWVEKARRGDEEAFGELVKMYHHRVYSLVYRMVRNEDDAQELTQQVWIRVWNKLPGFREKARFFTWLYRIASNMTLDFIRKRTRQRETSLEGRLEENPAAEIELESGRSSRPDQEVQRAEIRTAFAKALESLSPDHRLALTLREVDGLSYEEIGKVTKSRIGTVMSRIYYARKSVMEKMEGVR